MGPPTAMARFHWPVLPARRTDLGRAGTLSDRRRTDDGRGGKRYCCISSGTAAGTGTAENLTAWPVYRNHLRYPDVKSLHVNDNHYH